MPSCCPLCRAPDASPFAQTSRPYLRCRNCTLVFVPPDFHLSHHEEKTCYDQHRNSPEDPRYRAFLNRLLQPLLSHLKPGASGLDFGSGPGPVLSLMLRELGYDVLDYDPYYAPFRERLDRRYDFITVCEVAEHLADPAAEFARLFDCLNPGGVLGIMTSHIPPDQPFVSWHYQRDPTHICFYSESSLHWLAQRHGKQLSLPACNVALLF